MESQYTGAKPLVHISQIEGLYTQADEPPADAEELSIWINIS